MNPTHPLDYETPPPPQPNPWQLAFALLVLILGIAISFSGLLLALFTWDLVNH